MASRDDWLLTYRDFSDVELAAEIEMLNTRRNNFLSSQQAGSKSFSVDRDSINDQYTAAIEVRRDRRLAGGTNTRMGTTDFSGVDIN